MLIVGKYWTSSGDGDGDILYMVEVHGLGAQQHHLSMVVRSKKVGAGDGRVKQTFYV